MNTTLKKSLTSAAILGVFALIGTGLVAIVHHNTQARIAANERQALLQSLSILVPATLYDNALLDDARTVQHPSLAQGAPIVVYRARRAEQPVAAIFDTLAPDGYNGTIKLLVAVLADGRLAGVRVVAHKETPGLGDAIEVERSQWILHFAGKSLRDPPVEAWGVKRDGGAFDQFTGATITPRAVVKAVKEVLDYFEQHRAMVFAE